MEGFALLAVIDAIQLESDVHCARACFEKAPRTSSPVSVLSQIKRSFSLGLTSSFAEEVFDCTY